MVVVILFRILFLSNCLPPPPPPLSGCLVPALFFMLNALQEYSFSPQTTINTLKHYNEKLAPASSLPGTSFLRLFLKASWH